MVSTSPTHLYGELPDIIVNETKEQLFNSFHENKPVVAEGKESVIHYYMTKPLAAMHFKTKTYLFLEF